MIWGLVGSRGVTFPLNTSIPISPPHPITTLPSPWEVSLRGLVA